MHKLIIRRFRSQTDMLTLRKADCKDVMQLIAKNHFMAQTASARDKLAQLAHFYEEATSYTEARDLRLFGDDVMGMFVIVSHLLQVRTAELALLHGRIAFLSNGGSSAWVDLDVESAPANIAQRIYPEVRILSMLLGTLSEALSNGFALHIEETFQ